MGDGRRLISGRHLCLLGRQVIDDIHLDVYFKTFTKERARSLYGNESLCARSKWRRNAQNNCRQLHYDCSIFVDAEFSDSLRLNEMNEQHHRGVRVRCLHNSSVYSQAPLTRNGVSPYTKW